MAEQHEATSFRDLGPKDVLTFVLRLVGWYVLFLIPWHGLDHAYEACFRFSGNAFMRSMGEVSLSFAPGGEDAAMDTVIELQEGKTTGTKPVSSRLMGYLPTAFFIALVLATRAPWKRRLRRTLIGLFFVSLIVALRVAIDVYATIAPNPAFKSVSIGAGFRPTLSFLHEIAAFQPSTGFIGAGIVWVVLTLATEPAAR